MAIHELYHGFQLKDFATEYFIETYDLTKKEAEKAFNIIEKILHLYAELEDKYVDGIERGALQKNRECRDFLDKNIISRKLGNKEKPKHDIYETVFLEKCHEVSKNYKELEKVLSKNHSVDADSVITNYLSCLDQSGKIKTPNNARAVSDGRRYFEYVGHDEARDFVENLRGY